jgi:Domain of unknown function (DUF5666)
MARLNRVGLLAALVLASAVLVLLAVTTPPATRADESLQWTGTVNSRPLTLTGTWVVGGMSFETNRETQLDQGHGPLTDGACARVAYYSSRGTNIATLIASQEPYKCIPGSGDGERHMKVYSTVTSLPSGFPTTLTGTWVVGGVAYTAVVTTHFETEAGPFAVGSCVGVEYVPGSNLALELETQPAFKCTGVGRTPYAQVYGVVDQFPPELVGEWKVGGTFYTATTATHFEQDEGPFFVGGCVSVRYNPADKMAVEISTAEPFKCGGPEPVESKFFGIVSEIPTGTLGVWVVGGNSFVVTTSTQLEHEDGMSLTVGVCAAVEYYLSGTDKIAAEIGAAPMFKCTGGTFTNQARGRVSSFPPDLVGTWVITRHGGFTDTFEADTGTEFDQKHGSFAPGACVKVKYFVQAGVNHATRIETQEPHSCGGGAPPTLPGVSKVYATIDQFPTGTLSIGLWVIGGVEYFATPATEFEQDHGPFAVGACVKAKYTVVSDTNTLLEVETEDARKCTISDTLVFRSFGTVEAFPPDLIGAWQISGISYTAGVSTSFEQEHGFFAVGAFVEVKYVLSGTDRIALSIETHVAPDAGLDEVFGVLEAHDSGDDWSDWVVNGVTYTADPAIEVGAAERAPVVGRLVRLNTYRVNGVAYVTSASSAFQVFLPAISR